MKQYGQSQLINIIKYINQYEMSIKYLQKFLDIHKPRLTHPSPLITPNKRPIPKERIK